jgi:hypothetical protein
MKLFIVMECDDRDARELALLMREASKDFNGLTKAFTKMASNVTGRKPGSSITSWWWGYEDS